MRYNQLRLQKRAWQFTMGRASSVFSKPWRTFSTRQFQTTSNLVHISLMFFISKVHLAHRQDSILSVMTIFLAAHFPKNCDFFNSSPSIINLSTPSSSFSFKSTSNDIRINFCTMILEKRRQSQSFISLGIWTLNFIQGLRVLRLSSQVNHMQRWYYQYITFIFVILARRKIRVGVEKSSQPEQSRHQVQTVFEEYDNMHFRVRSAVSVDFAWSFAFYCRAEGVTSAFLKQLSKLSLSKSRSFFDISSASLTISYRSARQESSSSLEFRVPSILELEFSVVASSSIFSISLTF